MLDLYEIQYFISRNKKYITFSRWRINQRKEKKTENGIRKKNNYKEITRTSQGPSTN